MEIPLHFAASEAFPEGFTRVLSMGKEGDDVLMLQERLIELEFLSGKADRVYGRKTRNAVQRYQRQNNVHADGVAGVRTLQRLFPELVVEAGPEGVAP